MGSLSGVNRCMYCVSPRKILSHNISMYVSAASTCLMPMEARSCLIPLGLEFQMFVGAGDQMGVLLAAESSSLKPLFLLSKTNPSSWPLLLPPLQLLIVKLMSSYTRVYVLKCVSVYVYACIRTLMHVHVRFHFGCLRQRLLQPRLTSNSLCSRGYPWNSDPPSSVSQLLRSQVSFLTWFFLKTLLRKEN